MKHSTVLHTIFRLWSLTIPVATVAVADTGDTSPIWELGIGIGGLSLPDYRGSDHRENYLLPFPYIRYRGKRLRIDEDGARSLLFTTPRARLDISLAAGLPVSADNNPARTGMPDLDPTVEVGPALEMQLTNPGERRDSWWLKLPVRAVLSVDGLDTDHQGRVFAPYVEYSSLMDNDALTGRSRLGIAAGPLYANRAYHDYYYRVAPGFATTQRPAFETSGGYSGSRITLTWNRRRGAWWYGWFARYDNLSGSVFEDSPLVKDRHFFALGFALARVVSTGNATQ
ncbi:MAG: putative outer membrane protein [Gammaproteobacteria bacterium]|nr:MAG: putative outer membrane protein [Gammaproteobacteria bacterium]TND06777.1 MAG: putative outer membrane protein [Gammaproteobacteria bacterium]